MSADIAEPTELLDSLKIREAEHAPTHCASCWGQKIEMRHVDFGAGFDGPVMNAEQVVQSGVQPIAIDDLVICEECIAAAAKIIGMDYIDQGDLKMLRGQLADLAKRYTELESHNADLVKSLASKPKPKGQA